MPKNYPSGILSGLVKPKYALIKNVIGENYEPKHGIDIFIDLNTFISAMCSSTKYLSSLPFSSNIEADIVSSLVHILLHWKNFSRRWDDVRIFMIMNDYDNKGCYEYKILKSYLAPYNHKLNNERYTQLKYHLTEALNIMQKVLRYVPNSYLIRCDKFDSLVFPALIDDYDIKLRDRIIVSGNNLFTGYAFEKNCKVIFSKCRRMGISQLYDPLMIAQSISKIDDDVMKTFVTNKVFYNLLNVIIGDYDRGILGMTNIGISRFASDLLRNVEKGLIPTNPKPIESVLPAVEENFHQYIMQSYPLIDIKSHAELIPRSSIESIKSEQMIDMIDIDSLRQLSIDGVNLLELV